MSYLVFLLVFIVPPVLALAATAPRPLAGRGGLRARIAIPLVAAIALVYTTPWDNYLVYRRVWWYGPDRVLATIGYVPVEEYIFFVLQPLLAGLFLYHLLARRPEPSPEPGRRWPGALVYGAGSLAGAALLASGAESGLYLGLILTWACPVLFGMWVFGGAYLARHRRVLLPAIVVPTMYLWVADRVAIGLGIWDISNQYSFDLDPLGLPVEEAVFFLVTNLLAVKGTMLFLFGDRIAGGRYPR